MFARPRAIDGDLSPCDSIDSVAALMTEAVFSECVSKAAQCGDLDGPAVVAIGTFHTTAATIAFNRPLVDCVLTGKTALAGNIDIRTGTMAGPSYQTTAIAKAAFLKPDKTQAVGYARSSISGLLLCGLGSLPGQCVGLLHPNPERPFDKSMLPDIAFGEVEIRWTFGELRVKWTEPRTAAATGA